MGSGDAGDAERVVPPGQERRDQLKVQHYGPVPKVDDPRAWKLIVGGDTEAGVVHQLTVGDLDDLPRVHVTGDLHCASGWSKQDNGWEGVLTRDVVEKWPPARGSEHVIAYGQYGYSASLHLDDLLSPRSLLATHLDGKPLEPEHGFPLRLVVPHLYSWKGPKWFRGWEYADSPRRGFWEERGYHVKGDPWRQERYSYQERLPHHEP